MPRDSQGNFSNVRNWVQDAANGINIEPDLHQDGDDDQAQGLTDSLDRQGRGGMQADLAMGNNKVIQVNEGTVSSDAANVGQIQNGAFTYAGTDTGTANSYVVTLSPPITAYNAGLTLSFKPANSNTGASTLQVDGVVPGPSIKWQSLELVADTIKAGELVTVRYDGLDFVMINSPEILPVEYGGTGGTTALGTAAYEDVGTAIGDVVQLEDVGGIANLPAVEGIQVTKVDPDIVGRTAQTGLDPATDQLVLYDDSATGNVKVSIQDAVDSAVTPTPADQLVKGWVNFNGATTVIRSSYNVSGVVRDQAGVCTITWSAAAPDANYVVTGNCSTGAENPGGTAAQSLIPKTLTATTVQVLTVEQGANAVDRSQVFVMAIW